jgi:hypothetical protein
MRMRRLLKLERVFRAELYNLQLGVLVLAVGLEVLAHGNSLLDEHVEILWDLGSEA